MFSQRNIMFSFHVMHSVLPSIPYGNRTKTNADILKSTRDSNPLSISDRCRRPRGPAKRSLLPNIASVYIQIFTKYWKKISDLWHSLTCVRNLRPTQKFFPHQFNRFTNRSDTTYCKWICRRIVKTKFIFQHKYFLQMNSPWTPHRPSAWCPQVGWSERSSACSAATPGTPPPPAVSAGRSSRWIASSWRRRSRWECGWFHPVCPVPRSAGAAIAWRLSLLQPTISKSPPPRI